MEIQALQRKAKPVIIPSKKLRRGFHEGQHAHVQSILRGNRIQPKLKLGQPNDKYENEADRVAEQVMRMPASQSSSIDGTSPGVGDSNSGTIQRACAACASDEELIQIKTNGHVTPEVTPAIGADIQLLQSGGQPLSRSERSFFEPRIGANFSNVRVHNYTKANNVARSINARAFTHGHNVVFGAGEYSPNTSAGKKLFAHELTHVVQQSGHLDQMIMRTPSISDWEFHNTDGTNTADDNCCALCPRPLGVGNRYSGRIVNGMELQPFIANHESGASYDIGRVIERSVWEKIGGSWNLLGNRPSGSDDDPNNDDECLTPMFYTPRGEYYLYVEDQPGFGSTGFLDASATEAVYKASFIESVEITDAGGTTTTDPTTCPWHTVLWLTKSGGAWAVDAARSEIELGSVTVGTTAP